MKAYPEIEATRRVRLLAAVRGAARRFGTIRAAASSIGMPRSTFHEIAQREGIQLRGKGAR